MFDLQKLEREFMGESRWCRRIGSDFEAEFLEHAYRDLLGGGRIPLVISSKYFMNISLFLLLARVCMWSTFETAQKRFGAFAN